MRDYDTTSSVEAVELKRSGRALIYAPAEKIGVIEAGNFPRLGKFSAEFHHQHRKDLIWRT
jgi:hypothetical protein